MNNRNFYLAESFFGFVSVFNKPFAQPTLHVFDSKKERDNFMNNAERKNINHVFYAVSAKDAKSAYSRIVDDIHEFDSDVIYH